jgi:ABC-2 type transport system permease protein
MGVSTEAVVAWMVARTEARRSLRAFLDDRRQLAALAVATLGMMPILLGALPSLYLAGSAVASGELSLSPTAVRGQFVTVFTGLIGLGVIRALERSSTVEHADYLLTAISPRALAVGLLGAEFLRTLGVLGPVFLVVYGPFLVGLGEVTTAAVAVVAVVPALAATLAVGHALGLLLRLAGRFARLSRRTGQLLGVLGAVALVIGTFLATPEVIGFVRSPPRILAAIPLAPYGDLFVLGTPGSPGVGVETLLGIAVVCTLTITAVAVSIPLSVRLWFGDGREVTAQGGRTVGIPAALSGNLLSRSVFWLWLRGVRAPTRFVHLLYVVFATFPAMGSLAGSEEPLLWLPPVALGIGALLAGAAFGLNPLGDERAALPTVVLSPAVGTTVVRARMTAGVVPLLPFAVAIAVGAGLLGPMTLSTTALVVVFGTVLTGFSATLAVGLGALIPHFESQRVFGVESVQPTPWAVFGHLFGVGIAALVGFLAIAAPHLLDTPSFAVRILPVGVVSALLAVVGFVFYRYAIRRVETFTYE